MQDRSGRFGRTSVLPVRICAQNSVQKSCVVFCGSCRQQFFAGLDTFLYSYPQHSARPSCANNWGLTFTQIWTMKTGF